MNKHWIRLLATACLVTALPTALLTGCGEDSSNPADVSTVTTTATTTASTTTSTTAETTTAATTAETTTAATTTSAATTTTAKATTSRKTTTTTTQTAKPPVVKSALQQAFDAKGNASWTKDLMTRLSQAKDCVVQMQYTEMNATISAYVAKHGVQTYAKMSTGSSPIITYSDGTTDYTIDDDSKSFSKQATSASSMEDNLQFGMPADNAVMRASGLETVAGESFIYEEFDADNSDDFEVVRYYFDQSKTLRYCQEITDTEHNLIHVTISFETPDTKLFAVPAGYQEISASDMFSITLEKLFGNLGG